ncbi:hypothetical protein [Nocardioides lijunqiniae]|uniref:hypothetical protein n=1 Tax=Nocardioides lijunqiniae TaxID=2760832 RepID=UPI0018779322|nr:hypothetical protein [Nocardioides lijunqiniae]
MPDLPSADVLDLFAVPADLSRLPGERHERVRAGDLLLTAGRDAEVQAWLSPLLARLAVRLDERPGRGPRDLRVAMPVPARDGSWVVDGWGASRYEPGTVVCEDLDVTLAAGRLLHAELDSLVRERPPGIDAGDDAGDDDGTGPAQLVHAELAGNVLLDARGAPVVIDVTPAWRPVGWAEERLRQASPT